MSSSFELASQPKNLADISKCNSSESPGSYVSHIHQKNIRGGGRSAHPQGASMGGNVHCNICLSPLDEGQSGVYGNLCPVNRQHNDLGRTQLMACLYSHRFVDTGTAT